MFKDRKYNNKNRQIDKFASRKNEDNFIIKEDDYQEYEHSNNEDVHTEMMSVLPFLLNASLELAKLVIDNRVRNSEKMTDDDIYSIHRKSFQKIGNIFSDK